MTRGFIAYRGPSKLDGAPIVLVVTLGSHNPKTGDMAQAWVLRADVDPSEAIADGLDRSICGDCVHRSGGTLERSCYVTWWLGPMRVWRTFRDGKYPAPDLGLAALALAGQAMRVTAYGDPAAVPRETWRALLKHTAGWTGYCVAPETRVLTGDLRWVPAGDVRVGQTLTAFDEFPVAGRAGRHWRTATVTSAERIRRPCHLVHLADGTTVIASSDHPWLARVNGGGSEWIQTERLKAGRHRIMKAIQPWDEPSHSWDAGYLAAAFDGEGWIGNGGHERSGHMGHLGFTQLDNAMAHTVCTALDIYRFEHSKYAGGTKVPTYYIKGGVREVLRFLGQMRPSRLLSKFNADLCGRFTALDYVSVVSTQRVGPREVAGLTTTTGTFIAEGFASHNTHQWRTCDQAFRAFLMASVESEREAEEAHALGWRTFRTRLRVEPVRADEIICPASEVGTSTTRSATCGRWS